MSKLRFHRSFNILAVFTVSGCLTANPVLVHDDDQKRRRHVAEPDRLGKAQGSSSGQSNIAKSFLINSLRISRRVRTDTRAAVCVAHVYTYIGAIASIQDSRGRWLR